MIISAYQAAQLAYGVGVRGNNLVIAVQICIAESGLNTNAVGYNGRTQGCPDGSRDRGLWQINDCYHPSVSDACAFQAECNASAMYRISSSGTNWNPWSTYTNGSFRLYLVAAQLAVNAVLASINPNLPLPFPADGSYRATLLSFIQAIYSSFYSRADIVAAEHRSDWDGVAGEFIKEVHPEYWNRADIASAWAQGRHQDVFGEYLTEGYLNTTPAAPPPPSPLPPTPSDNSGQIVADIVAGRSPLSATARMLQRIVDETMDAKYGAGHRTGPIMGGIVQ